MRYFRYGFLAALALVLVVIAVANRAPVTLRLITDDTAAWLGLPGSAALPLYIVIFGGIIAGIIIGFIWEWLREHKQRAQASAMRRDHARLSREVDRLQKTGGEKTDDVLALLEN